MIIPMNVIHVKMETFSRRSEVAHNPCKITGRCLTISKTTNMHTVSVLKDET